MNHEIPESWAATTIDAVVKNTTQRVPDDAAKFVYIDISSINRDKKQIVSPQNLLGKDAPSRARKVVQTGDILVSMTRPNMNAVALVPEYLNDQVASTGFDVLRANEIDARWLFYLVRTYDFVTAMSEKVQGALYPAISSKIVREYEIPLAPLNEQKRIADKLDILLAAIDACRTRLDKVPTLIKRFRQSVLAAATSGALTEDWREQNKISSEWPLVKLNEIGEFGRGKSKHRPRNDKLLYGGDYPFIQTGDIARSDGFITRHSNTYSAFGLKQSKLWPVDTLCITIAANIADTALLTYPACFPDSIVGFSAELKKSLPQFVKYAIDVIKNDLESFAPATAQKNINLAILGDIEFNCPSLIEQIEIVGRVKTLFAIADKLEASLATARKRVDQLTPAILAQAFRGELVEQDPSDEPASALLARIAAVSTPAPAKHTIKKAA